MSTDSESLSSILAGSSAVVSSEAPAAKAEPVTDVKSEPAKAPESAVPSTAKEPEVSKETKPDPPRDEKGKFAPKTEDKPKPEAKPEQMVPLSALLAERAKRREPEAAKPKTSVLENEDQAFSERISEQLTPIKAQLFAMSVGFARQTYSDFDDVAGVFAQAANNDERLWQQMRDSENPALYVYQVGRQFKELAPFGGDVTKYRDHSVAETKAELAKANEQLTAMRAELDSLKKSKEELAAVPRSLNSAGSTSQPTLADADPADLRKLVRFGNT